MPNPQNIPYSFATCSLGTPTDPLETKLSLLSKAGFTGIELAFPDLLDFACQFHAREISGHDWDSLISAGAEVRELADKYNLQVMLLQPFSNFEGWPRGSSEREDAFERAKGWISIMEAVGITTLQVGSTDTPLDRLSPSSSLREDIITDLRELADLLKEKGLRLAYENWCWSSHAPGWKDVWEIVRDVNRDNIGLCLDTFQSAGGEWGDPTTSTGLIGGVEPGSKEEGELSRKWHESLDELIRTVPGEKIYLLQVSDAYVPLDSNSHKPAPLEKGVVDGTAPRGRWSHDYRPLPYDGGYLPIEDFGRAVLKTGFRGWFSVEVFDQGPSGNGRDVAGGLGGFAERGFERMGRFVGGCLGSI
ncbi:sugar phosphate isomerase/epimerase family protein [Aspergillus undulatus]|uniref:sugar phosphate isomerase/epimerase family protein n=1 Tax=Aspergillus undulatus TaxID=1810928 RepID=UPI003CCCE408